MTTPFSCDPITLLYLALFCTSLAAAVAAGHVHHGALRRVYIANALIYCLLGAAHGFGLSGDVTAAAKALWQNTVPMAASESAPIQQPRNDLPNHPGS